MADATWIVHAGLADSSCISRESFNFPAKYIRHYDLTGYVASNGGTNAWDTTSLWARDTSRLAAAPELRTCDVSPCLAAYQVRRLINRTSVLSGGKFHRAATGRRAGVERRIESKSNGQLLREDWLIFSGARRTDGRPLRAR